jgi:hypothetical protein
MFILKIILGLILAIAVGAIFTDNLGDGYFDFQKKAKAEAFLNKVGDIAAVMQTYKISTTDTVSVVDELGGSVAQIPMDNVVAELTSQDVKLLKGDASVDIGSLAVAVDLDTGDGTASASGESGVYLAIVSPTVGDLRISDEICDKINENIHGDDFVTPEANLSEITTTSSSVAFDDAGAFLETVNTVAPQAITGAYEGVCIKDSFATTSNNAFLYYVQEL